MLVQTAPGQETNRPAALQDRQFQRTLRELQRIRDTPGQSLDAHRFVSGGWFSSAQVKTLAAAIPQEDARLQFALAAYPRTVDPENFYDVYDAFTSYSKVFRLHDELRRMRQPHPEPVVVLQAPPPVSEESMKSLISAVRAEPMDESRKAIVRQAFTDQRRFFSHQIRDLMKVFTFEDSRLEIARLGYDQVIDPENYFVVNEAFTFIDTKRKLEQFITSRRATQAQPAPQ